MSFLVPIARKQIRTAPGMGGINNSKKRRTIMCKINGRKLGELRAQTGISRKKLADELGLSSKTIGNYETGYTEPTSEVLDKICFILKINREDVELQNVGYDFSIGESKTVASTRKQKGFVRYRTPEQTEEWIMERRTKSSSEELKDVKSALNNSFGIGKKRYILVNPLSVHIPEWQRDTDFAKSTEISKNYDDVKFDPIKSYIADDGKLCVADGAHRVVAFVMGEENMILTEVLNCTEREAILTFLDQSSGRKSMSFADTYRAGVKANIEDYIIFKNFFEARGIQITAENNTRIKNPIGYVRPSRTIIRMMKRDRETLSKVVDLIKKLHWCGSEKSVFIIRNFEVLMRLYSCYGTEVENRLLEKCKGAAYYEGKIVPIKGNAALFDFLCKEIAREDEAIEEE